MSDLRASIGQILDQFPNSLPLASDLRASIGQILDQFPNSLPLASDLRSPEWLEFTKSFPVPPIHYR